MSSAPAGQAEIAWVYESVVDAVPGIAVGTWRALAVQFLGFEVAVLGLGLFYRLPGEALVAGTVTVAVASVGSVAMVTIAEAARGTERDPVYIRVLLGSRVELVLGLLAYVGLVTYLFVVDPRSDPTLLEALLGPTPPAVAAFVLLLVLWDVCYRIGTAWWASVTSLWRALRRPIDAGDRQSRRRVHAVTVGFGVVQLALVPFVRAQPLLLLALTGHVVAVVLVTGAAAELERRAEN